MNQSVFVTKPTLFNILGNSAFPFAMYLANGTQEATAFRILLENVDQLDLNCDLVKNTLIPMLIQASAITQTDANNITAYVNNSLGI